MPLIRFLAALLLIAVLATPVLKAKSAEPNDHLVIADAVGDYGPLAPLAHHRNGPGYVYTSYVFDTLVGQDPEGRAIPDLAQSWQVSADGMLWNIMMDEKARWHDGLPVTANDVVFTISYLRRHPYLFASVANIGETEVLSDTSLRISLKRPDPDFLSSLLQSLPLLPRHIYRDQEIPGRFVAPRASIGSGPYRLVSYDKVQGRYLLERNASYHLGRSKYRRLAIVRMAPDPAIQAMRAGKVDIIPNLPIARIADVRAAGFGVETANSNHPVRLVFNSRGAFKERMLRHALAYAIDRQAIVDIAFQGAAVIAETGYFQNGSPWRASGNTPSYSHAPETAVKLLRDCGWTRSAHGAWSRDGVPVRLKFIVGNSFLAVATVVSDQLAAFGIRTDLQVLENAAVQDRLRGGNYDLTILSSSTMGGPNGIGRRVLSNSWRSDQFRDENGAMSTLLKEQERTIDPERRQDLLQQFQALYAQELPAYMLANPIWATAHTNRVSPRYLPNGIAIGIPMALHKSMLME